VVIDTKKKKGASHGPPFSRCKRRAQAKYRASDTKPKSCSFVEETVGFSSGLRPVFRLKLSGHNAAYSDRR